MHRFEKRVFKIRLFFIIMKKAAIWRRGDNDIQEHVPLKNDLMKIKQMLLIKRSVVVSGSHSQILKPSRRRRPEI